MEGYYKMHGTVQFIRKYPAGLRTVLQFYKSLLYLVHDLYAENSRTTLIYYWNVSEGKMKTKTSDRCVGNGRYRWTCGLRRRFAAAHFLESWVRITLKGCSSVVIFVCCVSSSLCDGLTTRSARACVRARARVRACVCVCVWDLESSKTRRPRPELGCCTTEKKWLNKNEKSAYVKWEIHVNFHII
jgi:hypothetical protein